MEGYKPVLAVSSNRDIVMGWVPNNQDMHSEIITLKKARTCVYYSSDCRGFSGLSANGPTDSCKISFEVSEFILHDIKRLIPLNLDTVKKWEDAPWRG